MRRGLSVAFAGGLVLGFAAPAQAAFPGLNGKIAFERDCDNNEAVPRGNGVCHSGVTTVNPDGSGLAPLTQSSLSDDSPAWSADGKRLAFVRGVNGDSGNMQIWTMNADGTNQANVTNDPNVEDKHPAWSPDGTKIAFIRLGSEDQVWVMNADGSGKHVLTTPSANGFDNTPNWSPDGSKIAFNRLPQGGMSQVYVVNADGSGTPTNLSNNSADDSFPNWSPDGSKIVFSRSGTFASEIWVMSATGGSQTRLTDQSTCPVSGFSDSWPVFSPDGTMIAFTRASCSTEESAAIWVMRADGSGANKITTPPQPEDLEPDWQPVGRVTSTAQIPPCVPNGLVTVTVGDSTGFKSPPRGVHYRLDFGAEQVALTDGGATATIAVPAGRHELEFWGQNQAGDQEAAHHNVTVTVDGARPQVVILRDQRRSTFRRGQFASVTIRASDTGGAGLVRNPSRRRLRISTSSVGTKTVRATAVDACGNTATALLRYRVVRGAVANRRANRPRFTG